MLSEEKINDKKYVYSVQLFDPKNADLLTSSLFSRRKSVNL